MAAGVGTPVVVTGRSASVPTTNVVVAALVMAGAALTFKGEGLRAGVPMPFEAVNVSG